MLRSHWPAAAKELTREFWTFFAAALCFDLGFAIYIFLYGLFLLDIGFNERQLGLVTGAMTLGAMTGTLPMGALAERFGLRRLLLAGFTVTPAVAAVRLFFPAEHRQIALAGVTGFALSSWQVCFSPAIAALTTKNNRTLAFSLTFSTGIATGALGGLAGGWLPGWIEHAHLAASHVEAKRWVLLGCCAVFALGTWPLSRLRLRTPATTQRRAWKFDPFLIPYLPAMALWTLTAGVFVPFAPAFLSRQLHLQLPRIGEAFSLAQIAQVGAILLAPIVFRQCGLVAGIAYTQGLSGLALAWLAATHRVNLAVGIYVGYMAIHWMSGPGIYSLLMGRVAETARNTASAVNTLMSSLCQSIAAAVAGAAYVRFGYPPVLFAAAAMALLSSTVFAVLLRERPRREAIAIAAAE